MSKSNELSQAVFFISYVILIKNQSIKNYKHLDDFLNYKVGVTLLGF